MTRLAAIGVAVLLAATPALGQIRSRMVASGFDHPIDFVQDPAHPNLQLVVEQRGRVRVLLDGVVQDDDFLDLRGIVSVNAERGLLGLAFAPDYAATGRFFVHFTDSDDRTVIARFTVGEDPLHANPGSRFDLVWPDGRPFIEQPECCHYGGRLAFGPDDMLYIALGDGAGRDDSFGNAQNPGTLLGKMLRINVSVPDDDPEGYDVPADNPWAGQAGVLGEIWAFGLRNPFRYSFDDPARGGTGALIIADVGQDQWEEFNYEPAGHGGRNFGWPLREGANEYRTDLPAWSDPLTDPTFQYLHNVGECIIGGVVYRGTALGASFYGRYFFGDFLDGVLWSTGLTVDPLSGEATQEDLVDHTTAIGPSLRSIVTISEDASGELYYLNYMNGQLFLLVPDDTPVCAMPDPYASVGGGRCLDGRWLPPGISGPIGVAVPARVHTNGDFDGDGRGDFTVYRPSTGAWYILPSAAGYGYASAVALGWGAKNDLPVPGDYDGDGQADAAVYRPSSGTWFVRNSSPSVTSHWSRTWESARDLPVPGDYDGDGRTDLAVFRPSNDTWYVLPSARNYDYADGFAVEWGIAGDVPVPGDYDGDGRSDIAVFRPSNGTWYVLTSTTNYDYATALAMVWGAVGDIPVAGDYDGDGRTDLAVFRPATSTWHLLLSSTNYAYANAVAVAFGLSTDSPVPGDFDGDGKCDIAVFRPSTGTWWVLASGSNFTESRSYAWGAKKDVPILRQFGWTHAGAQIAGDFDGDGHADITVYRPSTGEWLVLPSRTNHDYGSAFTIGWGGSGDVPVPGDYDGDGRTDAAVYRPSTGAWFVTNSASGGTGNWSLDWGAAGDIPVPGDYDGDGRTDLAVFRPSNGTWYVLPSGSYYDYAAAFTLVWGMVGDIPVAADYDGDGRTDLAVYRPSAGAWYVLPSTADYDYSGGFVIGWGVSTDVSVPGDYDGDGRTDFAVFRPSTGAWFILPSSSNYAYASGLTIVWGLNGDVPVPGDFDGDGICDIAVFRPSTGVWLVLKSSTNLTGSTSYTWGIGTDVPILKR